MIRLIFGAIVILIILVVLLVLYPIELLVGLFSKKVQRKVAYKVDGAVLVLLRFIFGIKIKMIGYENIRDNETTIYIANHRSIQDIVVTMPTLSKFTMPCYMAKDSLNKIPIFRQWMKLAGTIVVDRENPKLAMKALISFNNKIKSGISGFIFPEGTRNKNEDASDLLEFKAGAKKVAKITDVWVQPIAITHERIVENIFPYFKKEISTVEYLKPFKYSELSEDNANNFDEYCKDIISNTIKKNL